MSGPAPARNRSRAGISLNAVVGAATTYAALATFVLVFFFTFRATQSVAGDTVASLLTDAPMWIWLTATVCAGVVASALATVRAVVTSDD